MIYVYLIIDYVCLIIDYVCVIIDYICIWLLIRSLEQLGDFSIVSWSVEFLPR